MVFIAALYAEFGRFQPLPSDAVVKVLLELDVNTTKRTAVPTRLSQSTVAQRIRCPEVGD